MELSEVGSAELSDDIRSVDDRTRSARDLLSLANEAQPWMVEIRRRLHRMPEVGLQLPLTQKVVADELSAIGLQPVFSRLVTGVTATIEGSQPGPTIVLRADMDALPLDENTGLEFSSEIDGRMHACGHDLHMAMLLGAARMLMGMRHELCGRVLLVFQPGEEGHFGARAMLDEGLLDGVDDLAACFAIHVFTNYAAGTWHLRPGPMLASSDTIKLTIRGRGGHASAPHLAIDPIVIGAEVVLALQTMVTRKIATTDAVVVTIGNFVAGTAPSIIPDWALLRGTLRAVSETTRVSLHAHVRNVVDGICAAHGGVPELVIEPGYPMTINDREMYRSVRTTLEWLSGPDSVHELAAPIMPAEDFSYFLGRAPGAMVFLGARPPEDQRPDSPMNHSNLVVFDESVMASGAAAYAAVALDKLTTDR